MEFVHSLDLERATEISNLAPWVSNGGSFYWSLKQGAIAGYLTSPQCNAKLGYNFQGFQVLPDEERVSVAVIKPPNSFARFVSGKWVLSSEPVFVSCERIRETLPAWSGPIKFRLKIERIASPPASSSLPPLPSALSASPFVSRIKLGFSAAIGDMVDYALNFALPDRLGTPVSLTRIAIASEDGTSLPVPPGIEKDKMTDISFFAPGSGVTGDRAGASVSGNKILLNRAFAPNSRGILMFSFVPTVEVAGEIFQVSSLPSIALTSIEERNRQYVPMPEWVKVAGGKEFKWDAAYSFDRVVEVAAIAQESKDASAICDRLLATVCDPETAFLEMHPWGKKIPLSIAGGIDSGARLKVLPGLNVQSFRIVLGGLVRGVSGRIV